MVKTSSQLAIWLLLFLVVVIYFLPQILISIYPGEAGVHYRRFFGGTVTDKVFGEGLQIIFPWDKLYVYNVRVQEVERSLDVLTEAGLTASVRYSIRYHPEYSLLGVLHQRVARTMLAQ